MLLANQFDHYPFTTEKFPALRGAYHVQRVLAFPRFRSDRIYLFYFLSKWNRLLIPVKVKSMKRKTKKICYL